MSTPFIPVTHVIFDFDGLLVDTEPCYTMANQEMLQRFGKTFTREIKSGMMGRKTNEAVEWLLDKVGIADMISPMEYSKDYDLMLKQMFSKCSAMPGAQKLVSHLIANDIPVAICTGSCSRTFAQKSFPHKDWVDLIPIKVLSGDDEMVHRGKPFPDGFLETMKRFPSPPKFAASVLVFEDSPNGIQAALAAGMQCVMVPDKQSISTEFTEVFSACQILDSLEDFKPEDYGLPSF